MLNGHTHGCDTAGFNQFHMHICKGILKVLKELNRCFECGLFCVWMFPDLWLHNKVIFFICTGQMLSRFNSLSSGGLMNFARFWKQQPRGYIWHGALFEVVMHVQIKSIWLTFWRGQVFSNSQVSVFFPLMGYWLNWYTPEGVIILDMPCECFVLKYTILKSISTKKTKEHFIEGGCHFGSAALSVVPLPFPTCGWIIQPK